MKLNVYGNRPIILVRDPQLPMEAATKNYVDYNISQHANNQQIHLTSSQNTLLDNITVTYNEINYLSGLNDNIVTLLNSKFDKSGGTVTGNITIADGFNVYVNKIPVSSTELVNKAYVDSRVAGNEWKDPITDINLIDDSLSTPPVSPVLYDVYIVASGATDAWTGKDGKAVYWDGTTWVELQGRPVQVGDRFGVALDSSTIPGGGLSSYNKKLVTITGVSPYTYSTDSLTPGSSTLVFDSESHYFGKTYTYTDENVWTVTNTSTNITAGSGLSFSGNILNFNSGAGLIDDNDNIRLKLYTSGGLILTSDGSTEDLITGSLSIKLADTTLSKNSNGLYISSSVMNDIADRVSKTQNSVVSSSVNFDTTSNLVINYNITSGNQAVNKAYVDNGISSLTSYVDNGLTTKVAKAGDTMTGFLTLHADPVNNLHAVTKQYVDANDALKVTKAGDLMTGFLTLHADPTANLHAATKQYVDANDALKVAKAGDSMTGFLTLHADPTANLHATTKQYVDTSINTLNTNLSASIDTKVAKAGDTMTGFLTLYADPTANLHAATKQYVDSADNSLNNTIVTGLATKINKSGDSMTGYLTLHADPSSNMHAVTKQYVDNIAAGLSTKPSVRLATTTALSATYNNGTSGVNATLTGTSNGALVIDGKTVIIGDRILVKNQTNKFENGAYVVQQVGDASSPFILKRVEAVDQSNEIPGSYYFVTDGDTLEGTGWVAVVADPITFAVGTDDITINQFSGAGTIIAGNGLTLTGNTLDINTASSSRIVVNSDNIDLATTGVTPGSYTKVTVDGYGRVTIGQNPTTLAGYGIVDGQPLNANLTSLSNVTTNGVVVRDATNSIVTKSLAVSGVGLSISNPDGSNLGNIQISSNATDSNIANTIVARDSSGNFSASIITANLNGNATSATILETTRDFSITGDIIASPIGFNGSTNVQLTSSLTATGVIAGTYTKVTVDEKGRVTKAESPTTLSDYGIIDAVPLSVYNAKIAELEAKIDELTVKILNLL